MIRSTGTLALFLIVLLTARAHAHDARLPDPHIRSNVPELLDAVTRGTRLSSTLRSLVHHLDASDVIVYLIFDDAPTPRAAGHLSFISVAGGRRYLRIAIDRRYVGCQRIALLGHELQHAAEIADAASVTDQASLATLYRRIGFRSAAGRADCFDSMAAIQAGQQVQREVLAGG